MSVLLLESLSWGSLRRGKFLFLSDRPDEPCQLSGDRAGRLFFVFSLVDQVEHASRRSVFTRFPALLGTNDGATT